MSSNDSARFAPRGGASLAHQALDAQAALLPYALVAFVVSMPVFVWAGSYAANAAWMTASFALFAMACGATYAAVNWLRTPAAEDLRARARVHIVTGLVWAGCVAQVAAFADGAGPMREILLLMATAAAVICIFFTAPWLPSLLVVGAAAAAGPLIALFSSPHSQNAATLAWGGVALAFALALMLNRVLRRQFAMAAEREVLIAERAGKVEEASRLARSKSDLVATLSHEIRNGLTGVSHVLAAAAGRNGRAAPSREQLSAALDAVSDLIAVLNTTLDSETAEAGRLAVDVRPLDAPALVRDLMLLNRPQAGAKGLELSVYVAPELAEGSGAALVDPARVRQILANLIGNAIKFTVRGRVEARLSLTPEGRVLIEIADTGPGLSDLELSQAFEAFHRVERTSAGVPGAGLGLSLSRQLARLMNGELTATSAPGVGSCFGLLLPYDPLAAAPADLAADTPDDAQAEGRKLRILMAEDDSLNAAMMRAVLEQLGHQVVHAQDGRRAVDLARVCEFDLALIDGRMPGLDGPEATAAIRALDGPACDLPIIAVIGGDAGEALECTRAGADAVLRKPVSVTAVARAVADATAASRRTIARKIA
ncbi:ATP-binding protein [Phenylobacterium sp.]|uniref:ATP-binding protein n=1 Tax=Phenylobacterium sp. TaxID=1871053 RepID=UPI0025E47402|nr:ATP-binding protein [Phenylobacterium sp.]